MQLRMFPYRIDVINLAKEFPSGIDVILPDASGKTREEILSLQNPNNFHVFVEDYFDIKGEADRVLGDFIGRWGDLEMYMQNILEKLIGVDSARSRAITAPLSGHQLRSMIDNLALNILEDEACAELNALTDRFGRASTHRNAIVHGSWRGELVTYTAQGKWKARGSVFRFKEPISEDERNKVYDFKNQKIRLSYVYSLKRIQGYSRDNEKLEGDLCEFINKYFISVGE